MYGCGVGGSAGNKSSGNHDNAIADLCQAKLQGNLLADAEELIGVGEVLVDYIGGNTLDRAELLCNLLVRGDCQDRGLREELAYGKSGLAFPGGNDDEGCIGGLGSLYGAAADSLGDVLLYKALLSDVKAYEYLRIGPLADGVHHADSLNRVLALCGLAGKHDCVGAVQDGVRNVAGLSTGRTGVLLHGVKHLGSSDNELACLVALPDDALLMEDNVLDRDLNAHVAAGNHDSVGDLKDLVEVVDAFLVLNLGDDLDVLSAVIVKELADAENVFLLADEGCGNEVNLTLAAEDQVVLECRYQCSP